MDEQIRKYERTLRILEEQRRGQVGALVKLKRARNSLLDVFKLPPEVLGNIFRWNVSLEGDFGGLEKESHNFLYVCHHWSEVASRTPEVWSFLGNTLQDWARWCRRSETAPLDLVLDGYECYGASFDTTLLILLQDRVTTDTIRRVHLRTEDSGLLNSIIYSLTSQSGGIRSSSMESFVLVNWDEPAVDVSDFFAHYHFSKLRRLELTNCTISPRDHLISRTVTLTTLELDLSDPGPNPTTSQLLSILASNPILRALTLRGCAIPDDDGDETSFRVPLHHLNKLELVGNPRVVIRLLNQLDYPRNMEHLWLTLHDCEVAEISQTIGPWFRDYLQGRGRAQNGLGLLLSSYFSITLRAGDAYGDDQMLEPMDAFVAVTLDLDDALPSSAEENAILDLIACAPQEEVVYFRKSCNLVAMEKIYNRFPNLRTLSFETIPLSAVFPGPNQGVDEGILLSLQSVLLENLALDNGDWSPLTTFLSRRASSGNRLNALKIIGSPHMRPEVIEDIRGMVNVLSV